MPGRAERAVDERNQTELRAVDLEATISSDHPARSPRAFIEGLDFLALYNGIGSVEAESAARRWTPI